MNDNKAQKKSPPKQMIVVLILFALFIGFSYVIQYEPGMQVANNFRFFALDMVKLFPPAFILVGLFMVWVDRKTVEKYFGQASGYKGFVSAIILACTTLYPFVVVVPMAAALSKKGARLGVVLTYLGATAICRIPMTIFEASFLGVQFSILRYIVSLPLIVVSSLLIEKIVGEDYMTVNHLVNVVDGLN